jgi:hypothetical protein
VTGRYVISYAAQSCSVDVNRVTCFPPDPFTTAQADAIGRPPVKREKANGNIGQPQTEAGAVEVAEAEQEGTPFLPPDGGVDFGASTFTDGTRDFGDRDHQALRVLDCHPA